MSHQETESVQLLWARMRFAVVGPLLVSPPPKDGLRQAIEEIVKHEWQDPLTGRPRRFGFSTVERWYYQAKGSPDPIIVLRTKRRSDAGQHRVLTAAVIRELRKLYEAHKSWSYRLHADNLRALIRKDPRLGPKVSNSTVTRYMKANGMFKQKRIKKRNTAGTRAAEERLEKREVRSYEVDYVHGLWHLDFHVGSCKILTADGEWVTPILLAIIDDRSRVICHAQWYLGETTEILVHGFCQALQKRKLPRELMSDNGAAMVALEFTRGLERLSILHKRTLPYSPYQNAKQEVFWVQVEGRLIPMMEGETELTLELLNRATQAWIEREYHHKRHSELGCTPMERCLADAEVGRECPSSETLRCAFRGQVKRKQRRSDGTVSLEGQRFEIPSQYKHLEYIHLQYARWDLSYIHMVDVNNNDAILSRIYPLDKSENASGKRRTLNKAKTNSESTASAGIAPLLQELMADYAASGLPPAYLPKDHRKG